MKKAFTYVYIIAISAVFFSCEKTLDIKPDTSESRIVIEAIITDQEEPFRVSISKSGSYFSSTEYPKISGATVRIDDNFGNSTILYETSAGVYESDSTIRAISGRTYSLTVHAEGQTYTSTATMPNPVYIDSIAYEKSSSMQEDSLYFASCYVYDSPEPGNNYRFNFYKNSVLSDNYVIGNDKFLNGNIVPVSFGSQELKKGDSVTIEVLGINKATYDYYYAIHQITDYQGNNSAPDNPNSNISNGALGYFGAFAVSSKSIVIK